MYPSVLTTRGAWQSRVSRNEPEDPRFQARQRLPSNAMERLCARPGCHAPAMATFNFDGLRRVVWLGPLDRAVGRSAGDLCRRHSDRLSPPLHWELRDIRIPQTAGAPDASPAPSRYLAPLPTRTDPLVTQPQLPERRVAERVPLLIPRVHPERIVAPAAASTPLLARAFRAASGR
jgi:hypothetical protein